MEYCGSILHGDGQASHEISRRIAMARADFDILAHTWTHSALTWKQKLRTYVSLVESKLLYAMSTLVLTVAQRRKLNGFQSRCLRKILGVQPSYVSRISNATVLARSGYTLASNLLRKKQLQLFGKILRVDSEHPLKRACFIPDTWVPVTDRYVRRVGRPGKEWVRELIQVAIALFGNMDAASAAAQDKTSWNTLLTEKMTF